MNKKLKAFGTVYSLQQENKSRLFFYAVSQSQI